MSEEKDENIQEEKKPQTPDEEEKKDEEKETKTEKERMEPKKLYRSRKYRVFTGVCGGIGEYFNIDPNIVRFLWIISCLAGGFVGILGYIIAIIMIPEAPAGAETRVKVQTKTSREIGIIIGAVLIFLGVIFLFDRWMFFYFPYRFSRFWRFRYFDFEYLLPFVIILMGILYILYVYRRNHIKEENIREGLSFKGKTLKRSRKDKKITGVCGGIAEYFEVDSTIIRLLYILLTLFSGIWIGIIIYIVLSIIMPQEIIQIKGEKK